MRFSKKKSSDQPRQRALREPSPQPTMYMYHARRSESIDNIGRQVKTDAELRSRKRITSYRHQRLAIVGIIVLVLVIAALLLRLSPQPKIVFLTSANKNVFLQDSSVYQQAADKQFTSSIWNRNKFTLEATSISKHLTDEFPELVAVSVTVSLFSSRPTVYVQPAQPAAIFDAANGSFVLDYSGDALQLTNQVPQVQQLHLPEVTNESSTPVLLGHPALTSSDVTFIQTVVYELAKQGVQVSGFRLPAGSSELDAVLTGEPYYVKFNLQSGDARQQAGSFLATRAYLASQHITPVQYIDVRVDGRVYYQ